MNGGATQDDRLQPIEVSMFCDLTHDMDASQFVGLWSNSDRNLTDAKITPAMQAIPIKPLPRKMKCGEAMRRIGRADSGDFMDGFGLSNDGSIAVISGGFLYASLLGGGGTCYFKRLGDHWTLTSCKRTWSV